MYEFLTEHWISIIGTVFGFLYLYLEYKASIWMWLASILMAAFYVVIFYDAHLYASMCIYSYFLLASIYGWIMWASKGKDEQTGSNIIMRIPKQYYIRTSVSALIVWGIIYLLLIKLSNAQSYITAGDALTTSLNIVALWMASRKWADQWLLLIPANLISAILLFIQKDSISGIMFLVFFIVSIAGFYKWKSMVTKNKT